MCQEQLLRCVVSAGGSVIPAAVRSTEIPAALFFVLLLPVLLLPSMSRRVSFALAVWEVEERERGENGMCAGAGEWIEAGRREEKAGLPLPAPARDVQWARQGLEMRAGAKCHCLCRVCMGCCISSGDLGATHPPSPLAVIIPPAGSRVCGCGHSLRAGGFYTVRPWRGQSHLAGSTSAMVGGRLAL